MKRFKDKVAIVTGGSSGMGRNTALRLGEKGAHIAVVDINEEGGQETVKLLKDEGSKAIFIKADVTNVDDVKNYVKQTIDEFNQIDLFFNNAGIVGATHNIDEQPDDQINQTIDINVKGSFFGLKYVVKEMLKNGGGAIVNTASGSGLAGTKGLSSYSASKHAVVGLTKSTALEYADKDIRINAIAPGSTDTAMIKNIDPETQRGIESSIPMQRLGSIHDMTDAVLFLFSEQASYITGTVIPVDGGYTA